MRSTNTSAGTRRMLPAVAAAVVLTAVGSSSAAVGQHTRTYTPPFTVGPSGGDSFSIHSARPDGTVTVARAYPVPGVINCVKGGPYARLLVRHRAVGPVRRVIVSFTNALVDPFTFVNVSLRDGSRWYGTKTLRGEVTGSGTLTFVPDPQTGRFPRTFIVEFGLQQSSACPNADEGTVQFTKVEVVQ